MNIRTNRRARFSENDLKTIQHALHTAGLAEQAVTAEFGWHAVRINDAVEIIPVTVDCGELMDAPCWQVRTLSSSPADAPCACPGKDHGGKPESYSSLSEAVAVAIGEVVRRNVLAQARDYPQCDDAAALEPPSRPDPCRNDFIRHCLHH